MLLGASVGSIAVSNEPCLFAQDNFVLPAPEIEKRLRTETYEVLEMRGARFADDKTKRATLKFADGQTLKVKWKASEPGGEAVNNQPRYEVAAYELQKLFLGPEEYVVPPTVLRTLSIEEYGKYDSKTKPTFKDPASVLFILQYWLQNVTNNFEFDEVRLTYDSTYAACVGNLNLFTYLIEHNDANIGNLLISRIQLMPHLYVVDNGMAFSSPRSQQGYQWQELKVKRLPKASMDRLRALTVADLDSTLGVVAQFRSVDGKLEATVPGPNLDPQKGIRQRDGIIQFGLTESEIRDVFSRLQDLLRKIDSGSVTTF